VRQQGRPALLPTLLGLTPGGCLGPYGTVASLLCHLGPWHRGVLTVPPACLPPLLPPSALLPPASPLLCACLLSSPPVRSSLCPHACLPLFLLFTGSCSRGHGFCHHGLCKQDHMEGKGDGAGGRSAEARDNTLEAVPGQQLRVVGNA